MAAMFKTANFVTTAFGPLKRGQIYAVLEVLRRNRYCSSVSQTKMVRGTYKLARTNFHFVISAQ
jgi:hypothetical protein